MGKTSELQPIPTNTTLLQQTKEVKKQLEELRESNFLSKCRNLLGVSDFSARIMNQGVQETETNGESRLDSTLTKSGSLGQRGKIESSDESDDSVESLLAGSEAKRLSDSLKLHTMDEFKPEQVERLDAEIPAPGESPARADPKPVRHIYRYAEYDEWGSNDSVAEDTDMQWLNNVDGDPKFVRRIDGLEYYLRMDGEDSSRTDVDGHSGISSGGKLHESQTSVEMDLREQFAGENCQGSAGNHNRRSSTVSVPSAFFASNTQREDRDELLENSLGSIQSNDNMLGLRINEEVVKYEGGSFDSTSMDTAAKKSHSGIKSSERVSVTDLDQQAEVCADGYKPSLHEENIKMDSKITIQTSVTTSSESRNHKNRKKTVKQRTAEAQTSLRFSQTSAGIPRKTNTRTIDIQTERESLILGKTNIVDKQENITFDTSRKTSSAGIPLKTPKAKKVDTKNQQAGTGWLSELVPKEILERFGLEKITKGTARTPDQFHVHLHFKEKKTAPHQAGIEKMAEQRDNAVAQGGKRAVQASIQHFQESSATEEMRSLISTESYREFEPPVQEPDGGGEGNGNGDASWDALRSLCKTMGETVQEACQKISESEPTTDQDQSDGDLYMHEQEAYEEEESMYAETPRRSDMSQNYRLRREAEYDQHQSNRSRRTEAPSFQASYQRDGYYNDVDHRGGYPRETHHIREREHLSSCNYHIREREQSNIHHQKGYSGRSKWNMSPRDARPRYFQEEVQFVDREEHRYNNGFSVGAMRHYASDQRTMHEHAPRRYSQVHPPQYQPRNQHANHRDFYEESFASDLNSLPSIFSPAVIDRSVDEAEERWRIHQENLMNKLRKANSVSSGGPSRSGRPTRPESNRRENPQGKGRMHEERRQSRSTISSSSTIQQVARDMEMLSCRLQRGSRQ
ncbi:hypothetical protein BSKO_04497 [Bryopsis sp. KO-2023]|nr:hypothetical protein BSKO_04497 [Bryopsis sp. KO-2023]